MSKSCSRTHLPAGQREMGGNITYVHIQRHPLDQNLAANTENRALDFVRPPLCYCRVKCSETVLYYMYPTSKV